jgi:hypothetical protein
MSSVLNTQKLIDTIRRRAFIPRDQSTFTDDDFLEMATEEINIGLMDQIIEARGDYLVEYIDVEMDEDILEYTVPSRAHGNKLRDVSIVNSEGDLVERLTQVTLDTPGEDCSSTSFYMRNNKVVLTDGSFSDGDYLRMFFYIRPNKLVTTDRGATISTITDSSSGGVDTKIVAFTTMPRHFTSALTYDITGFKSPNKILSFDLTPTDINLTTKTITFLASDWDDDIVVGDFVTMAEETIVPNIPTEYHPVVAQRVAVACLESMGDEQNKQSAERKLAQMEKSVLRIVTNRVEGQPKKIRQRSGTLHAAIRNRTFRGV